MEKSFFEEPSDSVNTIEASIEIVNKKRRRKKRCIAPAAKPVSSPKSDRISVRTVRTASTLVSTKTSSHIKILAASDTTRKKRTASTTSTVGTNLSKKYSSLLFSANSFGSRPESPMFNRPRDVSFASDRLLNDTLLSEYEKRLSNSQINFGSDVGRDWEDLSQQISPRDSRQNSERHFSQMEIEYQSEVTFNQVFHSPAHESNFERPPSDYHTSETGHQGGVNDFQCSVNERIITQNLSLSLLTKQNHQIATQLQGLECYVREKMDAAEDYVKRKLTKIEETTVAVVKTLNEMKRLESDETNRRQRANDSIRTQRDNEPIRSQRDNEPIRSQRDNEPIRTQRDNEPIRTQRDNEPIRTERTIEPIRPQQDKEPIRPPRDIELIQTQQVNEAVRPQPVKQLRSTKELVMPSIPIWRDFSLVILNIALKHADYMDQFVSEASRVVTLNEYNCRKSVRSIMAELFAIDLLVKYRWSANTFSSSNKPTFSSLTNILIAIARLLTNYMSELDVRREVKTFFNEML